MTIKGIEKETGRVAWFRADDIAFCLMNNCDWSYYCNEEDGNIANGRADLAKWSIDLDGFFGKAK